MTRRVHVPLLRRNMQSAADWCSASMTHDSMEERRWLPFFLRRMLVCRHAALLLVDVLCDVVVAMILWPRDGVVAEPFCCFAPHPVEGVSLTIGVVPFALSRFTLTPETKQKHNQKQVKSANIVSATTRRKQSLFLSHLPS